MKINSYTLFGNKEQWSNSFAVIIRQHLSLYYQNDWELWVHVDDDLSDNAYCGVLKELHKANLIKIFKVANNGLEYQSRYKCMMMLWRMLPLWENTEYVFCRDLDSILTPRQLQCVRSFILSGKTAHGINDNVSHNIPLMGGMCGFKTKAFREIFNVSFNEFIKDKYSSNYWEAHGADQNFLMQYVWPRVIGSSFIHVLDGPNERYHLKEVATPINDINSEIKNKGDNFTNYIGAVGCSTPVKSYSNEEMINFYNIYGNTEKCKLVTDIENKLGWKP